MNLNWRKRTEDGGADVKGSPSGTLRDIIIVVAVTALIFCMIELLSGITLVIKYMVIDNPPRPYRLADIAWLSPFVDKKKVEGPEIYFKAPQPAGGGYLMEDSLLGYRLIPYHKYRLTRDPPLPTEALITNKEGFASIGEAEFEYGRKKPAGTYRVIVLGGSTVWGVGSATPDENISARLLKGLRVKYPNIKFEVINAGVGGYSSRNEFLYLLSELVYYSPDLVIAYDGWNDAYFNGFRSQKHERLNALKTPDHYEMDRRMASNRTLAGTFSLFAGTLSETIRTKLYWSATHRVLSRVLLPKRKDIQRVVPYLNNEGETIMAYDNSGVELYRDVLEMDIMVSKLHKFKMGIFLQPVSNRKLTAEETQYKKNAGLMFPLLKSFYADAIPMLEALKRQYKGNNSVCIADLSRALDDIPETVYNDLGHLRANGNDAVASKIIGELDDCGFFIRKASLTQ